MEEGSLRGRGGRRGRLGSMGRATVGRSRNRSQALGSADSRGPEGLQSPQREAASRAPNALGVKPDHILVDGDTDFVGSGNTTCVLKGDASSGSISAAAIVAKVVRDRIMRDLSPCFPGYDFESNKGYHSQGHEEALLAQGPSGIHRGSVKLRVKLKNLPMMGNPDRVRSVPVEAPSDAADYSRLSQWVDPDGVTRPSGSSG